MNQYHYLVFTLPIVHSHERRPELGINVLYDGNLLLSVCAAFLFGVGWVAVNTVPFLRTWCSTSANHLVSHRVAFEQYPPRSLNSRSRGLITHSCMHAHTRTRTHTQTHTRTLSAPIDEVEMVAARPIASMAPTPTITFLCSIHTHLCTTGVAIPMMATNCHCHHTRSYRMLPHMQHINAECVAFSQIL